METIYNGNSKASGTYKIVNKTNSKTYYGSAKCFQVRASQHLKDLITNKHGNRHLQGSFNLDGADSFVFEVLEVIEGTKQDRLDAEQKLLNQFWDNCVNCYNIEKTSYSREGSKDKSPEASFQRRSRSVIGRKHTEASKQYMSQIHKALISNPRMTGKTHTEETKLKMSAARANKRKIKAICISSGVISEFLSVIEASKQLEITPSCIVRVAKGDRQKTHGYRFEYMNE